MMLSVVVSAYSLKRLHDLTDVIDGIKNQTYNPIEAVIVIDESKELFDKINNHISINNLKNMQVIFNPENKGLSYSRNIGIKYSNGSIVAFIDDDAVPSVNWAKCVIETFNEDPQIGAVTGDIIPLWEYENMSWFPKELFWMISCSYIMTPTKKEEVERGFGTNMAFNRQLLLEVGMFNTNLGIKANNWIGGEDTDMFLNIKEKGKKVMFNPDARVLHKIYVHRTNTKNIIKRAFNGGVSVAIMKKVRKYNMKNSIENTYLKCLLLEFYPKKFVEILRKPSVIPLKQIVIVSAVMIFESMGYLHGHIRQRNYIG